MKVSVEVHNLAVRIYDALNEKGGGELPDAFTAIKVIEKEIAAQHGVNRTAEPVCKICSSPAVGESGYCQVCE